MNTTETDRITTTVPRHYPTLKLLFSGGLSARTVSLRPQHTYLGREVEDGEGIGLPDDKQASRRHARVALGAAKSGAEPMIRITDNDSKNGLFVNGKKVVDEALADGDIIRLGNTLLLLRIESADEGEAVPGLIGHSPAIREVYGKLRKAAKTGGPVLLVGETGTGKDVSARALHGLSSRAGGPFVDVNTSSIPEALAEGQLFGHKKGAFTGATADFLGLFRQADGGTLFLNEIGDMPLSVQAKLLSAIERKEVLPVGSSRPVVCDSWFLAATNRNLAEMARQQLFRDDLIERLKGTQIRLPPLRARQEDIFPILVQELGKYGVSRPLKMTARLAEALLLYHWPGNVRELVLFAQVIAADVADNIELDLPHVQDRFIPAAGADAAAGRAPGASAAEHAAPSSSGSASKVSSPQLPRLSPEAVTRLWEESGHNVSQFALRVARSRRQARRWLDELGLRKKE